MKTPPISRRKFLGTTASAAALSMIPLTYSCTTSSATKKPNSKVGGVQLGCTTYSYREVPHGLEEVLGYLLQAGINAVEMRLVLEEGLGIPPIDRPVRPPVPRENTPGSKQKEPELTEEQKAAIAKAEEQREAQRKWRLSLPMWKYEDVRKMYNNAGVDIHIAKFAPSGWSDEEIHYAYNAARVLGAYGITDELTENAARRLGPIAEIHKSQAILHTHGQFGQPGFDIDGFLAISPNIMLNLDAGHYYGSTGKHPNEIIEKYHTRIPMIHIKDKTGPNHAEPNVNKPFGQGETPIADILLLLKKEKWPIDVFVELEYKVPEDSDPVKEVVKCIEYMRNILE